MGKPLIAPNLIYEYEEVNPDPIDGVFDYIMSLLIAEEPSILEDIDEELSEKLQVHWQTILNYIRSGELEAVKLGKGYRISKESFDDFIDKRSTRKNKK